MVEIFSKRIRGNEGGKVLLIKSDCVITLGYLKDSGRRSGFRFAIIVGTVVIKNVRDFDFCFKNFLAHCILFSENVFNIRRKLFNQSVIELYV